MEILIIAAFVATSLALPQGYNLPAPAGGGLAPGGFTNGGVSGGNGAAGGGVSGGYNDGAGGGCNEGEILHVDGTCVVPIITRNVYLYEAPELPSPPIGPAPSLPPPKEQHNIVFVRLPAQAPGPDPIILPPPSQKSIVYVLAKNDGDNSQRVIEVTAPPPSNPEVYFVNYADGENPTLPLGVDLNTALSAASSSGVQIIGDVGAAGEFSDGGFGGGEGDAIFVAGGASHFENGGASAGFNAGGTGGFGDGGVNGAYAVEGAGTGFSSGGAGGFGDGGAGVGLSSVGASGFGDGGASGAFSSGGADGFGSGGALYSGR